ncbi:MAG: hypothetical protein COW73_11840 [Nitrospirae bacterium CG18_big_fil_WC_8_21_14_2_50_70_55]|nr:hypothetical protein [Deltaproteobacteria bacterium]OIP63788.1 MAG: hypothetical protein AUK30_07915 [Nitrospirae bacterium CG2_30_70_394]PIQ03051.1 MAG: hypothetical protein COW73_11840 [Nitrospirae bacterium CG18_big_fil_WC_8_21_14_2_50_70_55]PIU77860.1 MAG: hypothetical protein COS73_08735 [Nitrospirae bacterium CG06_land_8_20_14_3_00_70_43]PIW83847.1 MAG: hypothetical protein COZ96_01235 [Nitrospirae bacterium CG_4_8_14_3_um_filter_70_85]PIX83217.1 MAG: hypothetical protein COZ33_06600 
MGITVVHIAWCLVALPLVVAVVTVLAYARAARRFPVERGQQPRYQARCGGRIGRHGHPIPFLRIAVYDQWVVIAGRGGYQLPKGAIEGLEVVGTRTPFTVRLHHHAAGVPERLEVWPVAVEELVAALKAPLSSTGS